MLVKQSTGMSFQPNERIYRRVGFVVAAALCIAAAPLHESSRQGAASGVPGGTLQLLQHGVHTAITFCAHGIAHQLTLPNEDGIYGAAAPTPTRQRQETGLQADG
jgi:hypothetical protein